MTSRRFLPHRIAAIAALIALASPAAALDEAVRPRGPAVEVSAGNAGMRREPDVVTDLEGRTLVAWTRESPSGGFSVEARLADAGLGFFGPEHDVAAGNASYRGPRIAVRDGGFLILWNGAREAPTDDSVPLLVRPLSAWGEPEDAPMVVSDQAGTLGPLAVAALPDGTGFLAVWAWYRNAEPRDLQVAARRLAPNGAPLGSVLPLVYRSDGGLYELAPFLDLAIDASGDFLVTWTRTFCDGTCFVLGFARAFGADGAPRGVEHAFPAVLTGSLATGARAVERGGFLVPWSDFEPNGPVDGERSFATELAADGTAVTGPTPLTQPGASLAGAHLDVGDDTLLAVGRDPARRVGGAVVTTAGPELETFAISEGSYARDSFARVSAAPTGGFVVVWAEPAATPSHTTNVLARYVGPAGRLPLFADGFDGGDACAWSESVAAPPCS